MNKVYNPRGIKPAIPTDIDEADACMERFIRQKYQHRSLENGKPKPPSREDSSYSNSRAMSPVESRTPKDYNISPEGSPPPLPPKTGKFFKFGLRSSSSTSNLRRFGSTKPKVTSPTSDNGAWSPPPLPSRRTTGLGAPVADVTTASFESKMAALQEMGFTDNQRNEMVLKGLHEDLDRAVETLVRLGEGSNPVSRSRTPVGTSTRGITPKPEASKSQLPTTSDNSFPDMPSNNPFDRAVPQQTQTASYNPFDRPTQAPTSATPLESSFQNLQVSQPLFPHSTGGYPNQASSMQQHAYQQPFTPPVQSTFSQPPYVASPQTIDSSYNPFDQLAPPQQAQPQAGFASQSYPNPSAPQMNPFFNTAPQSQTMQPQSQQLAPTAPTFNGNNAPHANTLPAMPSTSHFGASPFGPTPSQGQQQQAPNAALGSYNPFQQGPATTTPQSSSGFPGQFQHNLQPQQPQQPQQLMPQPTGQMDKNSILSLYNMGPAQSNIPPIPQQPQQYQQPQPQPTMGSNPFPQSSNPFPQSSNPYATISQPQQSTNTQQQNQPHQYPQPQQPGPNSQSATTNNPFFSTAPTGAPTGNSTGAGSGLAAQAGINPYAQQQQQQTPGLGGGGVNGQNGTATGAATGASNSPFGGTNSSPFPGMAPPFASTHKSPFSGPPPTNSTFRGIHMSQPSVDVSGLQNGRHSPDAFASLSARYG
jgi:hypothetical protein